MNKLQCSSEIKCNRRLYGAQGGSPAPCRPSAELAFAIRSSTPTEEFGEPLDQKKTQPISTAFNEYEVSNVTYDTFH